jgi:hypothetical protein
LSPEEINLEVEARNYVPTLEEEILYEKLMKKEKKRRGW